MTASEFASRIQQAKQKGAKWSGLCPAHTDSDPSLGWWDGAKKIVFSCGAGCTRAAILAALHLSEKEMWLEPREEPKSTMKKTAATYDYKDSDGTLLYQSIRYAPKDFRQRRPDGDGWRWNLNGIRRVLYGFPELQGKKTVVICEGEKDADRLRALGLTATCGVGGKWRGEYVEQLKAAGVEAVVILRDNDEPGVKLMLETASACWNAGLRVKTPKLPGVMKKGDVSDWLDQGHTKVELSALISTEPSHQQAAGGLLDLESHATGQRSYSFNLNGMNDPKDAIPNVRAALELVSREMDADFGALDIELLLQSLGLRLGLVATEAYFPAVLLDADKLDPEPVEWLWKNWLALGKLHLIVGFPGEGKGFTTMHMAGCVSTGRVFPDGASGCTPGGVVILSAEDAPADTILPRLIAAEADRTKIKILTARRAPDGSLHPINLAENLTVLEDAITRTAAKLAIIDPLSNYIGNTNAWNEALVRQLLDRVQDVATRTGAAIIAIMHPNKSQGVAAIHRVSNSIAFGAAPRVVMTITLNPDDVDSRALGQLKNNFVKLPEPRGFSFMPVTFPAPDGRLIETAMLAWSKEAVKVDVKAVLEGGVTKHSGVLDEAKELIRELFGDDTAISGAEVIAEGATRDITEKSLERARKTLGLGSFKIGKEWIWAKTKEDAKTYAMCRHDALSSSLSSSGPSRQEDKNITRQDDMTPGHDSVSPSPSPATCSRHPVTPRPDMCDICQAARPNGNE